MTEKKFDRKTIINI